MLKKHAFLCLLIFTGALFISPVTLANAKLDDELSQAMSLEGDQEEGKNVYKERAWNNFDNYNAELLFQTG